MNTLNETETAPVVVATTSRKVPTIARRRVLQGKHKQIGAPRLQIVGLHVNKKRGAFTKEDIFNLNGQSISMLTITKRIKDLRKAGDLVRMAKSLVNKTAGRPPEFFNFDKTAGENKKPRTRKPKAVAAEVSAEVAPIVAEVAPEAVAQEAVAEVAAV